MKRRDIAFIEPDMWPPNSLDLNPVNYADWGALQQRVYQYRRFTTINHLKQAIVTEWGKLSFKTLDISQGSVATYLRCGGIFSDRIITNFLLILIVK